MPKIIFTDFIDKQFGRLMVTKVYRNDKYHVMAEANCSCGKKWAAHLHNLPRYLSHRKAKLTVDNRHTILYT